jgi:hypothetical protein
LLFATKYVQFHHANHFEFHVYFTAYQLFNLVFLLITAFLGLAFLIITGGIIFDAQGIISCCHLINFVVEVNLF